MNIYIILQNVASFRVFWSNLQQTEQQLVLIASPKNLERLRAAGQQECFSLLYATEDFSVDNLLALAQQALAQLDAADLSRVRVVTHDEYSLVAAAQLRERLGVDGDHTAAVCHFVDKAQMKRALAGRDIRMPRHRPHDPAHFQHGPQQYVDTVLGELGLPVFAKPINESGCVGAVRMETREQFLAWCAACPDGVTFELDEYIVGTLYHCDSIILDGVVLYTHVCEYAHPCYDYLSGKICASVTLPTGSCKSTTLVHFTEQVLDALRPRPNCTVTHLEVFETVQQELIFLEIAARAPGAMAPYVYEKHLGLNIEEVHFRLQMGQMDKLRIRMGPYCAWAYFPHRRGVVTQLQQPAVASQHSMNWKIAPGDQLQDPTDIRDFACSILLWNHDYDQLRKDFAYLDREYRPYLLAGEA